MSFVITRPEAPGTAAGHLSGVGSVLAAQNEAATTALPPAAADDVSALTATQFSVHAALYQAVSAQATAIHEMFTSVLGASAVLLPMRLPKPPTQSRLARRER
jgi:hypothetical protein